MDEQLKILIQALLDKQSTEAIKEQIDLLQEYCDSKKLNLKLNIDNAEFKTLIANLEKVGSSLNQALNVGVNSGLNKLSTTMNTTNKDMAFMEKRVVETTNAMGQLVRETSRFKQEVNEAGDPLLVLVKRTQETTSNFEKQRKEQQKLFDDLTNFQNKMLGVGGFQGELDIFAQKQKGRYDANILTKLKSDIQSLSVDTPDLQQKIKTLSTQFSLLKQQASQSGNVMVRVFENAYKFLRFYLVGGFLVRFVNSIKSGVQAVSSLDQSLTELNKVVSLSSDKLQSLTKHAYEAGEAIGRTGKEVLDGVAEFAKAGYTVEESLELSKVALVMTNVAEGINSVEEASSSLIAALKGYQLSATEAMKVTDMLNEVSNTTATNFDDLAEGLRRTSGTLSQTGTGIEELLGLLVGGFEPLRNIEMVSSGLQMISQRLRGIGEDGEAIDGLMPKLQEDFMEIANISIIDPETGGLRSTYDILKDMAEVFPTLTDQQKQYLAELAAGNRQVKVLNAILDNWTSVEKAIESAKNSTGSALRENEKYLESISGKVAQFNSAIQQMWAHAIDSDTIKSIIDLGTGIVKIVDAFGLLNTAIVITTASLILFNKGFQTFLTMRITPIIASWIAGLRGLSGVASASAVAIGGLTISIQTLTSVLTMGLAIVIPAIISGLNWLANTTERQVEKVRELKDEYDSLTQSLENHVEQQELVKDRLEELYALRDSNKITQAEKDELTRLENVNTELERQIEYEKTLKAIRGAELEYESLKLASQKTEVSSTKSNQVYAGDTLITPITTTVYLTVDEKAQENIGLIKEYTDAINELDKAYDNNDVSAEQYKKRHDELTKSRTDTIIELDELIKRLEEENTKYNDGTKEGTARRESNELIIASAQDMITALAAEDVEIQKLIASFRDVKKETEDFGDSQSKLAEKIRATQEDFSKYGNNVKTLQTALNEMSKGDLSETTLDKLIKLYPEIIPHLHDRVATQRELNNLLKEEMQIAQEKHAKETADAFEDVTNSLQSLYKIQNELNKTQKISAETTETIIKQHPELIGYLGNRVELEKAISEAIATQEQIQVQAYQNMLENSETYFNEQIKGNQKLWNIITEAYGKDAENFRTLAEVKDKTDVFLVNAIGARWKNLYGSQVEALKAFIRTSSELLYTHGASDGKAAEVARRVAADNLSAAKNLLSALEGIASAVNFSAKAVNFKGINLGDIGSSSKKVKEAYKPIIDSYHQISIELERINKLLEENAILTEQAEGSDKIALLRERINLLKQQESLLKKLNKQQEEELKLVKNRLKELGFKFDTDNNITNYAARLSKLTGDTAKEAEELIDRFVELSTQAIPDVNNEILKLKQTIEGIVADVFDQYYKYLFHNIEKEIDALEEQKQKVKEVAQAKIDALQAEIELLQNRNKQQKEEEERAKRLMDIAKQREKLYNIQNERNVILYNADGTFSLVADPKKVREETERLKELEEEFAQWEEELQYERQIQQLKDQIKAIEEQLKNDEKYYDDKIKALQDFLKEQENILSGAYDFQITKAEQIAEALKGLDEELYKNRLDALNNFIKEYNSMLSGLNTGNAPLPKVSVPKTSTSTNTTSTTTTKTATPTTPSPATAPKNVYTGNSLVDYLKSIGVDSSFENRKALSGLGDAYKGTAQQNAELLKRLRGFSDGGINTKPGFYQLHGTKSQPEAIFNTRQLNNLFKLLNNITLPKFSTPSLAGVGASSGGEVSNIFNVSIDKVQTNDADSFITNLKNLTNRR